jgi:hypothetical protein
MMHMVRIVLLVMVMALTVGCKEWRTSAADPELPRPAPSGPVGHIHGVVKDPQGQPVKEANIGILRGPGPMPAIVVLTNDKGEYSWEDLAPGEYTLMANGEGFQTKELTVTVQANQTAKLDFTLER